MTHESVQSTDRLLARFVLRARRVLDSRIARGIDIPPEAMQFDPPSNTPLAMGLGLQDEESLDAVAARVRPLLLRTEALYWERILDELEQVLPTHERNAAETLQQLRQLWEAVNKPPRQRQGPYSDRQLADRFLYGDLIHADELPADIAPFPLRLFAAQDYLQDALQATSATLQVVRQAEDAGLITLPSRCWSDAVTAAGQRTAYFPVQFFAEAPVGTALPEDFSNLPPSWTTTVVEPSAAEPDGGQVPK